MRITKVNNTVNFGLKIKQNEELEDLISTLQIKRRYSQKKIQKIMDRIESIADDSYSLEVKKVDPFIGKVWYTVSTDNKDAIVDERGDACYSSKFFLLLSIDKVCRKMIKINNTDSPSEL